MNIIELTDQEVEMIRTMISTQQRVLQKREIEDDEDWQHMILELDKLYQKLPRE
jgi:hypothetical protein